MLRVSLLAAIAIIIYLTFRLTRLLQENKRMAMRLVEVDQIKKNFISHVSHELKAPLASMQETTHLILERIPGPLTDKQKRLLELNLQSGKRLAQMIGNILDLSRLEAGIVEYEMQRCDLADLIHNVVMELSSGAREKSLRLLTDIQREPLFVDCDPNRMVQLFSNLLENAIRFSGKGGTITVHLQCVRECPRMPHSARARMPHKTAPNGFALIGISDSGPGIDDAHKETVFHTFHQMQHGRKSHGESLGLGLAISRAVVEAHAGTIWIEDNPQGGAMFFVLLPRSSAENEALSKAS
jgi:two-component system, NtrC family, sensor histidine kinase GlrK